MTGIGRFQIVAGQHFVSIGNRSGHEQFRGIDLEIHHPRFQGGASAYDVALVRLDRPLDFNEFVQPIALPQQSDPIPNQGRVSAFGWGIITDRAPGEVADELQTVDLPILANDLCKELMRALWIENPVSTSCMCTLMFSGSGNVCNADSGGPAVLLNDENEEVLLGVLAWGMSPCSNPDIPTVWSGIAPVRDWIEESMNANAH